MEFSCVRKYYSSMIFPPTIFFKFEMILGSRGQKKRGDGLDVALGPLFALPCSRSLWIGVIHKKKKKKKHCNLGVAQSPFTIVTSFVLRTMLEGGFFTLSLSQVTSEAWHDVSEATELGLFTPLPEFFLHPTGCHKSSAVWIQRPRLIHYWFSFFKTEV